MSFVQNSITANGQSTAVAGYNTSTPAFVGVQVTGTWTGTLTFELSADGVNWVTAGAAAVATGTLATTTTGNGLWRIEVGGMGGVRVTATAAITGTAVVTLNA